MPAEGNRTEAEMGIEAALKCACGMQSGKTKFTVENATKTRVVLADTRIHILGSYQNIRIARWRPLSVWPWVCT